MKKVKQTEIHLTLVSLLDFPLMEADEICIPLSDSISVNSSQKKSIENGIE